MGYGVVLIASWSTMISKFWDEIWVGNNSSYYSNSILIPTLEKFSEVSSSSSFILNKIVYSYIFIKFIHEPIIYYFKLILLYNFYREREREIQSSPPPFKLIFSDLCIYFTDVKLYDLYSLSNLTWIIWSTRSKWSLSVRTWLAAKLLRRLYRTTFLTTKQKK